MLICHANCTATLYMLIVHTNENCGVRSSVILTRPVLYERGGSPSYTGIYPDSKPKDGTIWV